MVVIGESGKVSPRFLSAVVSSIAIAATVASTFLKHGYNVAIRDGKTERNPGA